MFRRCLLGHSYRWSRFPVSFAHASCRASAVPSLREHQLRNASEIRIRLDAVLRNRSRD